MTVVFDTDVVVLLQKAARDPQSDVWKRLGEYNEELAITIVTAEEQMRGWLALIQRLRNPHDQVQAYERLHSLFGFYAEWPVLPWDSAAADVLVELRKRKIRVATMDLKIASIVLSRNDTLVTGNLRDFGRIPGLRVEHWKN